MNFKKLAIVAGFVAATSAAYAAVSFDSSTGTGFVGKGDVQLAFGWNNTTLQAKVKNKLVFFTYNIRDTYDVACEWETTTGKGQIILHDIVIPKHVAVNADVAYDPRVKTQITGFILKGFGTVVSDGTVPVIGGECPGNNPGVITDATLKGSEGGLYVNSDSGSVALPNTPTL